MAPRIWTGVAAPVAAVSVLLLVIAVGSAWYLRNMQESVAGLLTENVTSMRAAQDLELSVRDLRNQGVRYLISGDSTLLEPIPRLRERTMAALGHAETLGTTAAEQGLMQKTRAGLQAFFAEYDRMTGGEPNKADYAKTLALIDSVLAEEVINPTREYLRLNEGMLAKANEENQRTTARLTTGLTALGSCGALGGLLGGWVISAALRRSMQAAEQRLRTTARQLDEAARTAEDTATRAGRSADALDDVAKSAAAVLARLKQTERDALRAEQLAWAGQMAAGIAHEVRNPLMAIKLMIQALAAGRTGDRLRPRDMQVLEDEIVRLEQIVGSFLDFARPPRPDKKPIEVGPLVQGVADRVRGRAVVQGVDVVVEVRRPVVADVDANQLQQVLYNLLFNAMEAQPAGGVVRVRVGTPSDNPVLEICVEDEGPGLAADVRDRVFEPFVSTKEAGMGLGLSICRRIVEGHDGEITAADAAGGGAAFVVRLPLSRSTPPARSDNPALART
ncbi:sensor histidine kinase [Limnoglobus roseus]|uniref:histidine kinase n=1 Tax=Limnoglobus roseus TaxID=2598579 RepID=A0A5C1AEN1_9BACT|nr:ATP-binding protein [Limnoglobus roseus]QEL17751.1 histidine kinase [Limnoglobus roseus]